MPRKWGPSKRDHKVIQLHSTGKDQFVEAVERVDPDDVFAILLKDGEYVVVGTGNNEYRTEHWIGVMELVKYALLQNYGEDG